MWDSPSQRPEHFSLNPYSSLNEGLVFAGLGGGGCVRSSNYHDSSGRGDHGEIVASGAYQALPTDQWTWSPQLKRNRFDTYVPGSSNIFGSFVDCPYDPFVGATQCSMCAWVAKTSELSIGSYGGIASTMTEYNGPGVSFSEKSSQFTAWIQGSYTYVGAEPTSDELLHYGFSYNGSVVNPYYKGVLGTPKTVGAQTLTNAALWLGNFYSGLTSYRLNGIIADVMVWNRALSTPEIQQLADPSNVMLSGLILPPKRRIFKATAGPAFKPYWAQHSNNLIGAGI